MIQEKPFFEFPNSFSTPPSDKEDYQKGHYREFICAVEEYLDFTKNIILVQSRVDDVDSDLLDTLGIPSNYFYLDEAYFLPDARLFLDEVWGEDKLKLILCELLAHTIPAYFFNTNKPLESFIASSKDCQEGNQIKKYFVYQMIILLFLIMIYHLAFYKNKQYYCSSNAQHSLQEIGQPNACHSCKLLKCNQQTVR